MNLRSKIAGLAAMRQFDNRWALVWSRIVHPRQRVVVYKLGGMQIAMDRAAGDLNLVRDVLTSPMYRHYLNQLPRSRPLRVLDIGAGAGGFALLLKAMAMPVERIGCVEMNPRTCERLRLNLDQHLRGRADVLNAAVCGHAGPIQVRLGAGSTGDSLQDSPNGHAAPPATIDGITFDAAYAALFGDGPVDVCKLDIEAAEYDVLAGPAHTALGRCRWLIVEIHDRPGRSAAEAVRAIERLGFRELPRGPEPQVYGFHNPVA